MNKSCSIVLQYNTEGPVLYWYCSFLDNEQFPILESDSGGPETDTASTGDEEEKVVVKPVFTCTGKNNPLSR